MLVHGLETRLSSIQKVYNLFEEVGLPDAKRIYESYPHQLSGGQKQRVMIAMAMACNPSLLIADEPTTALDVTVQKKILEVLKQLCQTKSMAMLFISHDLNLVRELADRILVMYKGEIVEQGTAKLIFENPKHPYTKGLLNCRPPINKKLKVLPTLADFMQSEGKIVYENDAKQIPSDNVIGPEEHEAILKVIESQSPLLSIQNLTTSFTSSGNFFWNPKKKFKAIQEISFNLYKGEVLGLVGESGSGKSTLGRTICRLIDSESGSIMYNGVELSKFFETEFRSYRKKIQIIFQDPYASLNPTMKIGEAILEPMIVHNLNGNRNAQLAKVYELMESVGLPADSYDKYPHEFSGGQRQRISIARALSLEPEILICDECVSALDVNVQAQVLNLLNELKEKYKLSLLFITHDLSVVRFICDRVMVMKSGKLVELGSVEQVLDNPASEYTKLLLDSIPK
ncbi:MAG: ABC transporter ATP-binding protein, partial [Saprospiraceae bacterium]|nr:ABC transporter ATP-binding protein [Saprospiraceae bacterium]